MTSFDSRDKWPNVGCFIFFFFFVVFAILCTDVRSSDPMIKVQTLQKDNSVKFELQKNIIPRKFTNIWCHSNEDGHSG